jgi:3-hydroxybutyryl-CoA dehydrogenase
VNVDGLRVCVIGAGMMGHGIAQVFALEGASVVVHDPVDEALRSVPERIAANLRTLGADPGAADAVALESELDAALADADFVFEAAPEDLELKQELFAHLDRVARPAAVLASNTSVMRIGDIAARVANAERVVGTHWWNPPFLVPLVEVVQADRTAAGTVARTMELLRSVGKTPVENADLVGLELTLAIHDYVLPTLDPPSEPAAGLRKRVEDGRLGMATGEGFRRWTPEQADETRRRMLEHLRAAASD